MNVLDERGSAVIQFPVALLLLMVMTIGVGQVGYTLYARNVLASSAHEGARAAVENGRDLRDAHVIVNEVVRRATGKLAEGLSVRVDSERAVGGGESVLVEVDAVLRPWGVVPFSIPMTAKAEVTNPRASW